MQNTAGLDLASLIRRDAQQSLRSPRRFAGLAKPPDSYEYYRDIVRTAVETDAPPTPDLIVSNKRLAWWEAYLGIGEVSSFPNVLYLAITDVCNARCLFCNYAPETSGGRSVKLSDIERAGSWLKFVEHFRPNSALGEPLLHPQIVGILNEVRRHAPFINMGLTTNAALLTDEIIEALVGHLTVMVVSLNACRKDTYERDMAPLKWETTLDNLRRLAERKRVLGTPKPEVQVSIVMHKHNLEELPELPAFLRSLGVDQLRLLAMNPPKPIKSRTLYGRSDLVHGDRDKANRIFAATKAACKEHGVSLVFPLPTL